MAASLDELTSKIDAGERLSDQDVVALGSSRDIISLGMLASTIRRRLRGNEVTYVRVADLKVGTTGTGSPEVVPTFRSAHAAEAAGEVRIFQTPPSLDAAVAVVEKARDAAGRTPLSAFCLFELGKLPEGLAVVLPALKKAGLETIAQAPIDRLNAPEQALESLADAGLELARLTVDDTSTGSGSTPRREWTDVCRLVAELQTRLRTIRAFAPLARQIDATQPTTGYEDVKRVALARLLVDNIDRIQVDWACTAPSSRRLR